MTWRIVTLNTFNLQPTTYSGTPVYVGHVVLFWAELCDWLSIDQSEPSVAEKQESDLSLEWLI